MTAKLSAAVTVLASGLGQLLADSAVLGPFPQNTVIRVRVLASMIRAHSGDAAFFTLQAANLAINPSASGLTDADLTAPAFAGTSLGLAAFSSLQGAVDFHIEDLPAASANSFKLELFALVANTDSGASHIVDSMNTIFEVYNTQWDEPLRVPQY